MKISTSIGLAGLFLAGTIGSAQGAATLKVGDPAPKLQVGKWVQGEPVKELEKGKVYIVEFWATWCGPCRVSIPHLNEIHNQFKDKGLIVIGQDVWERDESKVEPFVKSMGEKMTYRVALDDKEGSEKGKMAETWMEAAGQNGIPAAFLINKDAIIAWIGHPMTLTPELVQSVLDGKFDIQKAQAEFLEEQRNNELRRAAQVPISKLSAALQKKDYAEVDAQLAEAGKLMPKEDFARLKGFVLVAKRDYPAVKKHLQETYDIKAGQKPPTESANPLNEIAWRMALDPEISAADLAHAETIARWADDASDNKSWMIMDTVARVLFRRDKQQEAIKLQQKALELADEQAKPQLEQTLESYKKGELPPDE